VGAYAGRLRRAIARGGRMSDRQFACAVNILLIMAGLGFVT
jgi:hypothetical protein